MPAPAYTTQVFCGELGQGEQIIYEVAPGTRLVIRDTSAYGNVAADTQITFNVRLPGSAAIPYLFLNPLTPGQLEEWHGRVAVMAGQSVVTNSSAAGAQCIVTGYLFTDT